MQGLVDNLPYWQLDDEVMVFDDLSLGVGYQVQGVDLSLVDDQGVNDFFKNLHVMLNSLPSDVSAQIRFKKSSSKLAMQQ